MARGKRAEKEFAGMYLSDPKNVVINPTEKQDCEEHWDLMINDCKVDVKAIKKNNENIHFIEFKNVQGKRGWLYGIADYFAFETNDYWIIVKGSKLKKWIHEKCKDKIYGMGVYELGSRPGARDLITKVKTIDLCYIGKIKKKV